MSKNDISDLFTYYKPEVPEDCNYIISPSMLYKFFNDPTDWYYTVYKHQESNFKGNTASVLGTICHYLYEQNTVNPNKIITRDDINNQLAVWLTKNPNPDVDYEEVVRVYPLVAMEVINSYVAPMNQKMKTCNGILNCEMPIVSKLKGNIYIAGTIDRIEDDCVVDYKTVATKPNENVIPLNYKYQLLTYAYALRERGYNINRIRIVYGIKPTKTISARCLVVTESITPEHEELIRHTLNLVCDTIKAMEKYPDLIYLFMKDWSLKDER